MAKVLVGMSGGVDSAVAAYLLKEEGYDVTGVTLRTWEAEDQEQNRCCEIDDARYVAMKIGIPFYALNCKEDFRKFVTEPFISSYISGETPNPCVECNRYVKWDRMMYYAKVMKADFIATGHYATIVRLDNGRYTVRRDPGNPKDQTYMLYKLTQEQLAATIMPLGNMTKDEVRRIAGELGLSVANKPDSQEICFVPDGDYAGYIEANYDAYINRTNGDEENKSKIRGLAEGNFVDEEGNILGRHKGIIHYTIGQRKGLGIAAGHPIFVKEINAEKNEVVISEEEAIFTREVICRDVNYLSIKDPDPGEKIRCTAKIRYRHEGSAALLEALPGNKVKLTFEEPVRAATPGQSAVFYDEEDMCIGGGTISK